MAGKFFVIEGTDGSGKTEQFNRLLPKLKEVFAVEKLDFPRYGEPSSYFVTEYLNGKYGTLKEIGPEKASLFYALDRFDASEKKMKQWLAEGKTLLANRYVGSNMGHQGGKIDDKKKRQDFFRWLYDLEYGRLGIPKPDLNIILHVPAAIAQGFVDKKGDRAYIGGKKRDLHESDISHLERAERVYLEIAELFPKDFTVIECVENGTLLSLDDVGEKVWDAVCGALNIER